MPEGDAVYRTAARLRAALDGRVLVRSDFRVPRHATADLSGRAVLTTASRGKHLLTRVEGGLTVHTHLRMDGSWRVQRAGAFPRRGDVVRLVLVNDLWQAVGLRLGVVELAPTDQEDRMVGHLGPDLLAPGWDAGDAELAVANIARDPETTIAEALLDQRNVAGLGTIWRAETLFLSGVHPWTPVAEVRDLTKVVALAHRLLAAGKDESGGPVTTGDRRPGRRLWAYGRAGRPCLRCGTTMAKGEIGTGPYERVVFYCPACQPR
ncbi:DNA-formamidopyrimidine glycosylase family protein [Sphaerisporangium sp. TRM90804]|uniref:DNA-formamidopyrimidine glycosylase family protein n=1 Tax=Sphaerisporangium sp. TRM90804 TaxID=3031113 RepID=UPI0024491206|nr:DNA-formamidopyrimidine glycosylase family protein [Sphaerisporangium sp. TRM90804]MDH2425165.1 DNA-formamidopyrimidine glycosylase family protein [Sphaerisporangium sp. TRM90804]